MKLRTTSVVLLALLATAASAAASAETLLVQRVKEEQSMTLPARGMTMAQVEARFGAPASRLEPRGGQKHAWPTINRWSDPAFTVYFEKNRVIDAVANKAGEDEVGPKPPVR
jgi:hypothetical protein